MKFQVHNLQNGSMKECDLNNLSRYLSADSEIVLFDGEKVEAIGFINHSLLVYFCVEFADYALQNYAKKKIPETEERISLVRKWIENPNSVSKEELEVAAYATNAAYAINAAYATYTAAAAAYATNAATNAAYTATAAANAATATATYTAGAAKEFERQGRFILSYFSS